MAIVESNLQSQSITTNWNGSSFDWTLAYTANTDVLLVRFAGSTTTPTTITYGGVALTQQAAVNDGDAGQSMIYHLLSPASGPNNLVVDTGVSAATWRVVVSALDGVDTGTAVTTATDSGFKDTLSSTVVTVADNFVVDVICLFDTFTAVAGSGQTETTTLESANTSYTSYTSSETATTTSTVMDWALTGSAHRVSQAAVAYTAAAAAGPTITDVNTTETVQVGDTPIVTGTSFLATGGTQSWGGVSVGFSSWSDTSITSSAITRGDLAYDTNYDWVVTDNLSVASSPLSVQLAIETGFQFVTLSSPIIALVGGVRTSLCYGAVPDCVTGDQLRVPLLTDQGKSIDISGAKGEFNIVDAGNTEQTFNFEIWDADAATGDKWSASTAVVVNGAIVSGGILRNVLRSPLRNILRSALK